MTFIILALLAIMFYLGYKYGAHKEKAKWLDEQIKAQQEFIERARKTGLLDFLKRYNQEHKQM